MVAAAEREVQSVRSLLTSSGGGRQLGFSAFCLDVRTLTFCQLLGSIKPLKVGRGAESNPVGFRTR